MSCSKLPSNSQKLMLVDKVDIVTAAIGQVLATEGGFCTGSARVIDHQRLSSSGYVFFASLPPYLASAVITAINVLEENPHLITKLEKNIATLRKGLSDVQGLEIVSDPKSPIVFLKLKNSTGSLKGDLQVLDDIAERVLAGVEEASFSLKVMVNKQKTKLICPSLDRGCQDDSLLQNVVASLPFHNATVGERARWRFCIEIRATTKEANCTRHSIMINTT